MIGGTFDEISATHVGASASAWPLGDSGGADLVRDRLPRPSGDDRRRDPSPAASTQRRGAELYNALENLCISRGIPMPQLQIIETDGPQCLASGLREGDYVDRRDARARRDATAAEVEAVLAHELTHIRNRDTQIMVIAVIFAGIFGFFADLSIRGWDFPFGLSPRGSAAPNKRPGWRPARARWRWCRRRRSGHHHGARHYRHLMGHLDARSASPCRARASFWPMRAR